MTTSQITPAGDRSGQQSMAFTLPRASIIREARSLKTASDKVLLQEGGP